MSRCAYESLRVQSLSALNKEEIAYFQNFLVLEEVMKTAPKNQELLFLETE